MYVLNNTYKTLHLLAPTRDMFLMWHRTVEKLYTIRLGLIDGNLDHNELRETLWEKQYWKAADTGKDQSLNLDEVKSMCVRLNIDFPKEEVERLFKVCH